MRNCVEEATAALRKAMENARAATELLRLAWKNYYAAHGAVGRTEQVVLVVDEVARMDAKVFQRILDRVKEIKFPEVTDKRRFTPMKLSKQERNRINEERLRDTRGSRAEQRRGDPSRLLRRSAHRPSRQGRH